MRIKVTYKGSPDKGVDKAISESLKKDFIWYAQGYDFEKDERDICFDSKDTSPSEREE